MIRHFPIAASLVVAFIAWESQGDETETIVVKEWSTRNGNQYRDRNGDGIVDWQATGSGRHTDGFGIYKEDNDFDGFFEREYKAGGFDYQIIYDRKIREKVPPIHRMFPPTKVTKTKREKKK